MIARIAGLLVDLVLRCHRLECFVTKLEELLIEKIINLIPYDLQYGLMRGCTCGDGRATA